MRKWKTRNQESTRANGQGPPHKVVAVPSAREASTREVNKLRRSHPGLIEKKGVTAKSGRPMLWCVVVEVQQ